MFAPLRNADLPTLASMLQEQNARKHDLIAHSSAIHAAVDADNRLMLYVDNAEPVGVDAEGTIVGEPLFVRPSDNMCSDIAGRLDIPLRYWRKMQSEHVSLLAYNVNEWLDRDDRQHLLRTFRTDDTSGGGSPIVFGRAMLSDRFECIDNFDVLLGVLDGVRTSCPSAVVESADLNERKMRLRITAPEISQNILPLIENYRPLGADGPSGTDLPLIFAGLFVENSETGGSAYTIGPRAVVQVCKNGMTRTQDTMRRVHLGGRLDEGVINWSDETRRAQVTLIRNQAADAVGAFLSQEMLDKFVAEMSTAAGVAVQHSITAVENVTQSLGFSDEARDSILEHFLSGAGRSALDLANAVTLVAQTLDNDEQAAQAESDALTAAMSAARLVSVA